ncbi:Folic acid synthesis protein [Trichinella pseudospiralis]
MLLFIGWIGRTTELAAGGHSVLLSLAVKDRSICLPDLIDSNVIMLALALPCCPDRTIIRYKFSLIYSKQRGVAIWNLN